MIAEPVYFKAYTLLTEEERKRFSNFVNSLEEGRGVNQKLILYEDILTENEKSLSFVFKATRHDDVKVIARNELTTLPRKYIQRDYRIFENILLRAVINRYGEQSQNVINNIFVLYTNCDFTLSPTFVTKEVLGNPGLTYIQQIMFSRVLSESEYAFRISWDEFDLASFPQLVPAYANFYKNDDPLKSIRAFAYWDDFFRQEYTRFIVNCIEDCLIKIAKKKMYDQYLHRFDLLPIGIKALIGEIIDANVNLNNYFNVQEEHRMALELALELEQNQIFIIRDLNNLADED